MTRIRIWRPPGGGGAGPRARHTTRAACKWCPSPGIRAISARIQLYAIQPHEGVHTHKSRSKAGKFLSVRVSDYTVVFLCPALDTRRKTYNRERSLRAYSRQYNRAISPGILAARSGKQYVRRAVDRGPTVDACSVSNC
eukprot:SAG31_NODE_2142_length_6344_cov_1.986709_6_plen_139_part_00